MALVTRILNNTGDALCDSSGTVLSGVTITFQLVDVTGHPTDVWDAISGERVAPVKESVVTDASGEFTIDLWPNDRGHKETMYLCIVRSKGVESFMGAIASSVDDLLWIDFMAQGVPLTPSQLNQLAVLNGLTASATELNYSVGVTSPIQNQLDAKVDGPLDFTPYFLKEGGAIGTATNNTTFEADGTLVMNGAATVWNDVNISLVPPAGQSSALPTIVAIKGDAYLDCYAFSGTNSTPDEIHGSLEIPHSYKEGTDLQFHLHWAPTTTNVGNVHWQLRYAWFNNGSVPTGALATATDTTSGVAWQEQNSVFTLSGAGMNMGSRIIFCLFRDPVNAADTYAFNSAVYDLGFHFEQDTLGSRLVTTK